MSTSLVISGCCGRMGMRIATLALADSVYTLAGALEARGHQAIGQDVGPLLGLKPLGVRVTDDVAQALAAGDVLIEFTRPEPTLEHLQIARRLKKPMVIGTTGFSYAEQQHIRDVAHDIAIVFSPNMSVGVNVLFQLVQNAAACLGPEYDVAIVEAHHRGKQDAPSGTAKRLSEVVADMRPAAAKPVEVQSVRAGDIVGDHTVIFAGPAERLELTHRAHSRDAFATGALKAAQFVRAQKPGLYDMSHVLQRA